MRASKIALLIGGVFAALLGLGLLVGGGVLLWAHGTQRDDAGFYTTSAERFSTSTYALTADADFGARPDRDDGAWWSGDIGTVRLDALTSTGRPLFIGIARTADVRQFLGGVAHEEVTGADFDPFRTDSRIVEGGAPTLPAEQTFWSASAVGASAQSIRWPAQSGDWSVVVMNADGSRVVAADIAVGLRTGVVLPIGIALAAVGLLLLAGGIVMTVVGARNATGAEDDDGTVIDLDAPPVAAAFASADAADAYPARLDADLEPVSRWLWVVKVFLLIPHFLVLAVLWTALVILTVVAGFAILFTGRYPRSIFGFNVGVMRWMWRVSFYSFAAFGTDRYPPFSLQAEPGYPARFTIDYPERLSRGLVLVKWWLLAIPHLLIVGVFAGGVSAMAGQDMPFAGGGLIALIALISAVVVLFSGQYPRTLFDFAMGMNRWSYRVLAYVTLMTDEYPPFRFDAGGTDPGSIGTAPPPPGPSSGRPDPQADDADLVGATPR